MDHCSLEEVEVHNDLLAGVAKENILVVTVPLVLLLAEFVEATNPVCPVRG